MIFRVGNIPQKLVLALIIFCIAFFVLFMAYSAYNANQRIMNVSKRYQNNLSRAYEHSIAQHQQKLSSIVAQIKQDAILINYMESRERMALYSKVKLDFDALKLDKSVAAINFYTPSGKAFLRIDQPQKYGDTVTRNTLQNAMQSEVPATGIEAEFINQPLLSIVHPWRKNGKVLGYIEVASQLMHILNEISEIYQVGLLYAVDKKNLQTGNLYPDVKALTKTLPLEETHRYLISYTNNPLIDDQLFTIIEHLGNDELYFYDTGLKDLLVATIPVRSFDSKTTPKLFFVTNLAPLNADETIPFYIMMFISFFIIILTISFYFYYGRKVQLKVQNASQEISILKTEIAEQQHHLEDSQKRYQALFEKTTDALILVDGNTFIDTNQACLDMFGYSTKEELFHQHPSVISPEKQPDGRNSNEKANEMMNIAFEKGSHRFEWNHKRKSGEVFPVEVLLTAVPYGDTNHLYAVCRDITERKKAEAEIKYRAHYDTLTELPNRNLLYEHLQQAYAHARQNNIYHALLFLDVDRFKNINDSMGHTVGDDLLIACSKRIKSLLRQGDLLARFGGDEFVLLINDLGKDLQKANFNAERIAETIRQSFQTPIQAGDYELQVTLSVGITTFPYTDKSVEDVLKYADAAMYKAKDTGRNKTAFFVSSMQDDILRRLDIEKDLRGAMENNEIYLEYQPKYDSNGDMVGVEALARWKHPKYGMVSPEEFVSVAEETGNIGELGNHIFQTACDGINKVYNETNTKPGIAINVSPRQLTQSGLLPSITSIINHFGLDPECITLEITEHLVIENFESIKHKLYELQHLGLKISLDDFGTGYSSLSYLQQLPLEELKIDRSFIMNLEADSNESHLVKTIIEIGHEFDLSVVAEGVETLYQLNYLKKLNCNHYQGYYLAKPMPLEELISLINDKHSKRLSR